MLLIHVYQTWLAMYPYPDIKIYVYLETKCMINVQKTYKRLCALQQFFNDNSNTLIAKHMNHNTKMRKAKKATVQTEDSAEWSIQPLKHKQWLLHMTLLKLKWVFGMTNLMANSIWLQCEWL